MQLNFFLVTYLALTPSNNFLNNHNLSFEFVPNLYVSDPSDRVSLSHLSRRMFPENPQLLRKAMEYVETNDEEGDYQYIFITFRIKNRSFPAAVAKSHIFPQKIGKMLSPAKFCACITKCFFQTAKCAQFFFFRLLSEALSARKALCLILLTREESSVPYFALPTPTPSPSKGKALWPNQSAEESLVASRR